MPCIYPKMLHLQQRISKPFCDGIQMSFRWTVFIRDAQQTRLLLFFFFLLLSFFVHSCCGLCVLKNTVFDEIYFFFSLSLVHSMRCVPCSYIIVCAVMVYLNTWRWNTNKYVVVIFGFLSFDSTLHKPYSQHI